NYISRRIMVFCLAGFFLPATAFAQAKLIQLPLTDLSEFNETKGWELAGTVFSDLQKDQVLETQNGTGILVNHADKKGQYADIFTKELFGDIDLELEYMLAPNAESGIYLQGRYEIQLKDSWAEQVPHYSTNGGVYARWWETSPDGVQAFEGIAPRQNASKAPGLWQKIKISFQAPRFDPMERKIRNAVLKRVELN